MTLKNNRAPLLSNIKLCASFHHQMWIQTGATVRKRLSWVLTSVTLTFDLWPCPFSWTLLWSLVITPENFMMIQQVHLFMQEHEKRKPWQVVIPIKYHLTMIYRKYWLLSSNWDESILLSYHICIKSQQLMSRITNVKGTSIRYSHSLTSPTDGSQLSFNWV